MCIDFFHNSRRCICIHKITCNKYKRYQYADACNLFRPKQTFHSRYPHENYSYYDTEKRCPFKINPKKTPEHISHSDSLLDKNICWYNKGKNKIEQLLRITVNPGNQIKKISATFYFSLNHIHYPDKKHKCDTSCRHIADRSQNTVHRVCLHRSQNRCRPHPCSKNTKNQGRRFSFTSGKYHPADAVRVHTSTSDLIANKSQ